MELYLGNDNYFVTGSKNAAIYDLRKEKIYELNESAKLSIINFVKKKQIDAQQKNFVDMLIKKQIINPSQISSKMEFEKPKFKIKFAWLELTEQCNLRCVHCYGNFGELTKGKTERMKLEEWFKAIDDLYDMGCRDIQLIGGEPFCYKNIFEIIKYLHKKGFKKITCFTNATLIDETKIKQLKKYNVNVRFSLYGYNAETHESITQIKGSFEKTVNAIKKLKANNLNVSVAVILMKENEHCIENIKKFIMEDLKINYTGYDVIRPSCINDNIEHRVSDYNTLGNRYYIFPRFRITKKQFEYNHFYNACLNEKIAITSSGDILPCIFSRNSIIGNVKDAPLQCLKKQIEKSWEITKNKIKICQDCEYRYACSDCRPLALGIFDDKLAKYPRCCYSPEEGVWKNIKQVTQEIN